MAISSGWNELKDFSYVTRRIQRYEDESSFASNCPECNAGSPCTPDEDTFVTDHCVEPCKIDPIGDWLSVPEPSIQTKIFFMATGEDGNRHDIIWEYNVDYDANVAWTYACLDTCSPPDGKYEISNYENALSRCPYNPLKYCNTAANFFSCLCFACDDDKAQHFVVTNAW